MAEKVDLDDLERKARAVSGDLWRRRTAEVAAADHIAANRPLVTLALIARIRELEQALRNEEEQHRYCGRPRFADGLLKILEKGAVIQ